MSNVAYIVKALLRRGPAFILLYLRESLAFDIVHRTNTHLRVPRASQPSGGSDYHDGVLYVASLTSVIRRTLAVAACTLGEERFREAQFFDLGCGKGKTLLVYAMHYSQHAKYAAVGIEYEPALWEIARTNARKLGSAGRAIELHCDSALNIERYIKSPILVIYLYNPFHGKTLRSFLSRIAKYPHVLIYVDPVEKDLLQEYGYRIQASNRGRYNASTWLVASNYGTGPSLPQANVGAA